ncbi:MAG: ABC transporter ATP-binding protein [bacterium]|nr:ABC transporter ATP-binding protein [bacterium]
MIKVTDLRKSYGEIKAVDGISFDIQKGETFGLLGPNGAGKTTTINMVVGVLPPDSGEVQIDNGGSPSDKAVRRKIGNAPQSIAIYQELTGEENIAFFGKLYGLRGSELKERIDWTLNFSGLKDRRKDKAVTYSGGMQRRLNLACSLVHDPPIVLLDEPTVGVDPQSRNHIFDSIEKLKKEGLTVIYTTHYMEEAQRLCDRVAIIDQGKILALDTVDGLIDKYGGKSVIEVKLESPPNENTKLPGVLDGTDLRIETENPAQEISNLVSSGIKFLQMRVERADLENVFLNLTGRRLRDE